MESIEYIPHKIISLSFILNNLRVIDLNLILFLEGYSALKNKSQYRSVVLSINNETRYVPLLFRHRDYDICSIF